MAYEGYATVSLYEELELPEYEQGEIERALKIASRHIDSLTFNRIVAAGFENLTDFQKEIIQEVVCRQAAFEMENADVISSILSSYSINGVSMQFGDSWNIFTEAGVAMERDLYSMLQQTGLCVRIL